MRIKNKKRKIGLYVSLIFIFFIFIVLGRIFSGWIWDKFKSVESFKIDTVEIKGKLNSSLKERIEKEFTGKSIFFDPSSLRGKILNRNPIIKEIRIIKKFPSTVSVEIYLRQPILQIKGKRVFYLIDEDGRILKTLQSSSPKFPLVEINVKNTILNNGLVIKDERIKKAIELVKILKKDSFSPSLILANDLETFSFIQKDSETKIILGKNDLRKKIDLLKVLVKRKFKGDLSTVRYIDLRGDRIYIGRK